jgi:hypothetical protein
VAKSFTTGRRVFYALLVLGLVAALAPATFAVKPDKVRDFNRCMETCNGLKDVCDLNCETNCFDVFPDVESPEYLACLDTCNTACARLMQNCKGGCKFELTGKTPNLP